MTQKINQKKLLRLYLEAGVDEIISENPINRLLLKVAKEKLSATEAPDLPAAKSPEKYTEKTPEKTPEKPNLKSLASKPEQVHSSVNLTNKISTFEALAKLALRSSQPMNNSHPPLISIAEIIATAKEAAQSCSNLQELEQAVKDFNGCSLKKMATNTVFADGDANSQIMIIGEAPGNHEDLQGIPFCGDSGKLLNEMFKAIGFKREKLYITNTLFWRPPGNRRPTEDELAMCRPFVEKHIALMQPKLIVLMGATAMADVLKIHDPISKMCGKFFDYQNQYLSSPIKTTVLFHPSYLMRQSSKKRETWADLLAIKKFLGE